MSIIPYARAVRDRLAQMRACRAGRAEWRPWLDTVPEPQETPPSPCFGFHLAMSVLESRLYHKLDREAQSECNAILDKGMQVLRTRSNRS